MIKKFELANCPLCDSKNVGVMHRNGDSAIMCFYCGCTSGFAETEQEAVQQWNNRPVRKVGKKDAKEKKHEEV